MSKGYNSFESILYKNILKSVLFKLLSFTCVESLEANVISRFPFKPSKDGTRIKISETCTKTSVCCNDIIIVELFR